MATEQEYKRFISGLKGARQATERLAGELKEARGRLNLRGTAG